MSSKWQKSMTKARNLLVQGLRDQAEQALVESAREAEKKSNHAWLAESLYELGVLRTNSGSFEEAESALLRALFLREQALGPTHEDVAITLSALGKLYAPFESAEAERLLRRSIAIYRELQDSSIVYPTEYLSLVLLLRGRRIERRQLLEELFAYMESNFENAALTGKSLYMLAKFHLDENESLALDLLQQALELLRRHNHFSQTAAEAALAIAKIQFGQKQFSDAENSFKTALELAELVPHESQHITVEILFRMSRLYMITDQKFDAAERLLERAAAICLASRPPLPVQSVIIEYEILFQLTGKCQSLEKLRRELLNVYKSDAASALDRCRTQESSCHAAIESREIARLLRHQNRLEEAEPFARWSVEADGFASNPKFIDCLIELALLCAVTAKEFEANQLCDRIMQLAGSKPWYVANLVDAIQLTLLLDRDREAQQLQNLAEQLIEQHAESQEWCIGLCQRLSIAYVNTGRKTKAKELLERALLEAEKRAASDDLFFAFVLEHWAAQLRTAGSPDMASNLQKRADDIRRSVKITN